MNATPTKEQWSAAAAEAAHDAIPAITPETRQEKAILTGDYAGSVEAILMDMNIREKMDKAAEDLESAHALLQSAETRDRATEAYSSANKSIHELESVQLTEAERQRLFELTNKLITVGLEFAVPTDSADEYA